MTPATLARCGKKAWATYTAHHGVDVWQAVAQAVIDEYLRCEADAPRLTLPKTTLAKAAKVLIDEDFIPNGYTEATHPAFAEFLTETALPEWVNDIADELLECVARGRALDDGHGFVLNVHWQKYEREMRESCRLRCDEIAGAERWKGLR
jgi:hypothetical protein